MASVPSKLYTDDVSLLVVLLDVNPFFWSSAAASLPFSHFLSHVLAFLNSIMLLSQMNQVVVIATGYSSCGYIYDSSSAAAARKEDGDRDGMPGLYSEFLRRLEEFVARDESSGEERGGVAPGKAAASSLLSGSLSMALCYIQRIFRSGLLHPQPRILCLQGSPDGPEQYVAVMNSIFSAQRSMVPIDSCYVGAQNSAFLQQASHITGGVYAKPQHLDGLFQHMVVCIVNLVHHGIIYQFMFQLPLSSKRLQSHAFPYLIHYIKLSYQRLNQTCLWFPSYIFKLLKCSLLPSRLFFLLICILAASCNFLGLLVWISVHHVFATNLQLTWATYALYACPFSVSTTRNAQLVGQYLVKLSRILLQHLTARGRLQNLEF